MLNTLVALAFADVLISTVYSACIPDVPRVLLPDVAVLQHSAVVTALEVVQQNLSSLAERTGDSFSFAIVNLQDMR